MLAVTFVSTTVLRHFMVKVVSSGQGEPTALLKSEDAQEVFMLVVSSGMMKIVVIKTRSGVFCQKATMVGTRTFITVVEMIKIIILQWYFQQGGHLFCIATVVVVSVFVECDTSKYGLNGMMRIVAMMTNVGEDIQIQRVGRTNFYTCVTIVVDEYPTVVTYQPIAIDQLELTL